MNPQRLDIYKDVHKGIRKELFDLSALVGSTEFNDAQSLQALKDRFGRTYNLLETHAHSEDTYVEPLIQACDPQKAQLLAETHNKLESEITQLKNALFAIEADASNAVIQGQSMYLALTRFVGEYLEHIAGEEQVLLPVLWENYDDKKLMEVSITIRANIPPPVMGNFLSCMIPAMNHGERVVMLGAMKQAAPEEVFNGVCQLSQSVLTTEDWNKLDQSLNQVSAS